jgi:hypothetical protein
MNEIYFQVEHLVVFNRRAAVKVSRLQGRLLDLLFVLQEQIGDE